jgi:hypothetical protein
MRMALLFNPTLARDPGGGLIVMPDLFTTTNRDVISDFQCRRAEAQNYTWCAIYSGRSGGTNCGFTTFQQCMDNNPRVTPRHRRRRGRIANCCDCSRPAVALLGPGAMV